MQKKLCLTTLLEQKKIIICYKNIKNYQSIESVVTFT